MPAKRLFGIISIIFLFVTCISCKSSTDLSEEKRILVIQSYEKHFPAYEKMKEIMSSELRKKGIHASVYSFYLDCEQYSEKQQRQKLFKKLNGLSTWNPDIILVNDDQALNALISSRHPLAKSIPVVFMGVSYPNIPIIRKYPNMTGFYDKPASDTKYISGGIYCLTPQAIGTLERCIREGMSRMRNFQRQLVSDGLRLEAYPFSKILDVDHAGDITKAEAFLNGKE